MSDIEKKNGELTGKDLEEAVADNKLDEVSGGVEGDGVFMNPKNPDGKFFQDGTFFDPKKQDGVFMNPKSPDGTFLNPEKPDGKH